MSRQPRGDTVAWSDVLAHRPAETRAEIGQRFAAHGVTAEQVREALSDGGDALFVAAGAAGSGTPGWADSFGGPLGAALLAAEVSALAAHLNSRASAVRAVAVDALLDDFSAVTVAAHLGVSRQKVYEISRGRLAPDFIDRVPWGQP